MYKDPTEFRARFKAYKEGKMPYENGLPKYSNGTPEAVDDATLDFIINHEGFKPNAWVKDPVTGKMLLGSGIDIDKYKELFRKTGKWSAEDNRRAVRDIVIGNRPTIRRIFGDKYNSLTPAQKGVIDDVAFNIGVGALANSSPKFVAAVLSGNMKEAKRQMDWGNHQARGLVNRNKDRQAWWDSMSLTPVEVPAYIARPQQQQLPPIVPELKTYLFPYETQQLIKPLSLSNPTIMSRPSSRRLPNDLLWSLVFDDEPKQDGELLYAKNGKLPRYRGGKTVIGSNVNMNDDGTFTDDYTRAFEDIVITPKGPRVKAGQLYKYQEPWDDEKFLNAVTVGGLNNLSPAQWARRAYDVVTGNMTTESWLNGNAGIVPTKYAEEHPNAAMAANALFDFWTLGGPSLLKNALQVGKLNPVSYTKYEPQPIAETKPTTVLIQPKSYLIEDIPGYQLKTLMRGNPLEKQLSKSGTISTNSIQAQANKASEVEKAVINKILSSKEFAGLKSVDYNKFRKAVHDDLITYNVVPDAQYADYGINRLGFNHPMDDYHNNKLWEKAFDEAKTLHPDWNNIQLTEFINSVMGLKTNPISLRTFTFESPMIPVGNSTHYNPSTLGHSRAYFTQEEPHILHVMESQSDWALQNTFEKMINKASRILENPELLAKRQNRIERLSKELEDWENMVKTKINHSGVELQPWEIRLIETEFIPNLRANIARDIASTHLPEETVLPLYLSKNYTARLIQENLKYAAEHGLTKMRYPTSETAAKIEGYSTTFDTSNLTEQQIQVLDKLDKNMYGNWRDYYSDKGIDNGYMSNLRKSMSDSEWKTLINNLGVKEEYLPEHKTILKKYADFPKQFKKLHKNTEVREVTDTKGNTWYEVDVPKDFLKKEWMYGMSIPTVVGAGLSLNANGKLPSYSNGKISIKPANRGKLTALKKRTGHSASWFKENGTPAQKKMAVFALNAKKWKH